MRLLRRFSARRRLVAVVVTSLALAVGGSLLVTSPVHAESNGGVRIMPLGDSITDGHDIPGGYRIKLWQEFANDGRTIDFVGSGSNGPASLGDHDHEGHSGWRIDQLDAQIVNWLRASAPRTVLLQIGTNDVNQNYDLANAPQRLSTLIDHIRATDPNVELFVAQITPESGATSQQKIDAYNATIPGIVTQKGPRTHVVDMHSAITTADLLDGVHPNAAGYDKMAVKWYEALQSVPSSMQPVLPSVGTAAALVNPISGRCLDVAGASTTAGTQVQIYDCKGSANQQWTRSSAGELRVYGDRCLDVQGNGTANGTRVQIWTCNGSTAQRFTFRADNSIVGVGSGKCLDIKAAGTANATIVQLYDCNSTGAQRWDPRTNEGAPTSSAGTAGATTPFKTVEAESGVLAGTARVRSIAPGAAAPTKATLETEASGYGLVELKTTGDSVALRNTTGISANALVVRASIPDTPNGGGADATVNLYVDGKLRQAITLSSRQAWNYRGATTNPDDPGAGGMPYRFYNEFPVLVTGAPIAAGSSIGLRKDTQNTAAVYDIDSVDLENVGSALTQPANSLSVLSYGADPNFGKDSTVAIQNAVNAARSQGRSVWIPPGKYLTNSLAPTPLNFSGVKVNGAGMWYSTIYRKVPLPANSWRSQILVGSGTTLTDVQIDSNAVWRGIGGSGGSDYGINASGAGGWLVDRIWTRHTDANWLSGSNGVIRNSRTADSYGDGFNANNGNTANPDRLGRNITIQNNFARGTGDDSFATYSDAGPDGTNTVVTGAKILNNTAVAPWWANGIRVAGGQDVEVRNNLVNSVSSNNAMDIGVFGDTGHPLQSATITGNVLIGGGGWNGLRNGVQVGSPGSGSLFPTAFTTVTFSDNTVRGSLRAGIYIGQRRVNITLRDNTIDHPAKQGIWIPTGVSGTGQFSGQIFQNLFPGQPQTQNESPTTFNITS